MAGKYTPLADWLRRQPRQAIQLTFRDVEDIVGFRLPASSRLYLAHWYGAGGSRVATAIREAGWHARLVDLRAERLTVEPGTRVIVARDTGVEVTMLGEEGVAEAAKYRLPPADAAGFAEGAVVNAVVRHLSASGWVIRAVADAALRERGDDVRAERDGVTLVVEAKGYPSRAYADPRRAAETKPTHPSLQARHWLSNAVLTVIQVLGTRDGVSVAIALPHTPRYDSLITAIEGPLRRLGVGVLFVSPQGEVVERVPIGPTSEAQP